MPSADTVPSFCFSTCKFFPLSGMPVFFWFMAIYSSRLSLNIMFPRKCCQSSVVQVSSVYVLRKVPSTTALTSDAGLMQMPPTHPYLSTPQGLGSSLISLNFSSSSTFHFDFIGFTIDVVSQFIKLCIKQYKR